MNTQSKVTAALQELADRHGYDLLVDSEWSNTGTMRFQRPTSSADTLTMKYSFQNEYVIFSTEQLDNEERRATEGVTTQVTPKGWQSRGFNEPKHELAYKSEGWYREWHLRPGTSEIDAFLKVVNTFLLQRKRGNL